MFRSKQALDEKQQLIPHFRQVIKSWELLKENKGLYGSNLNIEYFGRMYANHLGLFRETKVTDDSEEVKAGEGGSSKLAQNSLDDPAIVKHGMAVTNFLDAVVEFVSGNEDCKPVLYALGRSHKDYNVTEKMFLEMKNALLEVMKPDLSKEQYRSWEVTLEYIYLNYVFKGMYMKSPLNMELK